MTGTNASRGSQAGPFTVGVLSPVVGGSYFGKVLSGIARALRAGGHQVVAIQTYAADLDRERFPDGPRYDVSVGLDAVDGVIVITSAVDRDTLRELDASGTPLVVVSEQDAGLRAPMVTPDNRGGVRAAVEHLVDHGHSRIGFLGNPQQLDIRERYEAYRSTLVANGIEPRDEWVLTTADNQEASGGAAAGVLMSRGMPTTATVAATDRNALGFVRALRSEGVSLPADHAVIGFDHIEGGARSRPRLSSVDPHHDRVGELAAGLLLARLGGEVVGAGAHLSETTLVTRESCGCIDSTRAGLLVDGVSNRGPVSAAAQLSDVARAVLFGAAAGDVGAPVDVRSWVRSIVEILVAASQRAVVPGGTVLNRLADATTALHPHPEALEQLLVVVRALELEAAAEVPGGSPSHARAVRAASIGVSVALTKGCSRGLLARSGHLERTLVNQYEIDLALMRSDGASPRSLSWLPAAHRGPAALALWTGHRTADGDRELEIVGTRDVGSTGSRLVGMILPMREFPPVALTRTTGTRPDLTFVIPVTFADSDWGLLSIGGPVDTRSTSARDKYNHWAAMLAVALDHEQMLTSLREQRAALEVSAMRERELAEAVRASEERYALASMALYDGMWDWDVLTGAVYYSSRWKSALGYEESEIGSSLEEWTDRVHPDDRDELSTAIAAQLAGVEEPLVLEQRILTASGEYRWVLCRAVTVLNEAGCPGRMVGAMTDLSESKRQEQALRRFAVRDAVPGLVHLDVFADRLDGAVERAQRLPGYDCSVVLLRLAPRADGDGGRRAESDLDAVVDAVREVLGAGDTATMRAPDEVAVLLDCVAPEDLEERVEVVREYVGERARICVVPSVVGIGDADHVLREAERMMLEMLARNV
ncbi:substrate-binding domain-containing protein [Sanguibacter suaedae]|uniref:Substrate-binding domain-containing protein n=1 Tax=Sanguibacter suaedae TaxID=2795737 RepID=A0A934IE23_9MICO|nr:substrate-binding domain-containing protein [Sanguibacter suaedae]MBI9115239.1 substrate-binding domain-containing protein [Sanguibacter suaedae]